MVPLRNTCQTLLDRQRGQFLSELAVADTDTKRMGELFKFFEYLQEHGIFSKDDKLDDLSVEHVFHKYAYIAKMLGARLNYEFTLLNSGAFSTDIAIDVCRKETPRDGTAPFDGNPHMAEKFMRIVRGKSIDWIRITTFAFDPKNNTTSDEFVHYVLFMNSRYDRPLITAVYDHVNSVINERSDSA